MAALRFQLQISGLLLICLGVSHAGFGRFLDWKRDLAKLTLANRQIFYVHSFFVAVFLVLTGLLLLFFPDSLVQHQPLSRAILGGLTLVWALRLCIQCFVFDSSLWRTHPGRRSAHYVLTVFWTYLVCLDAWALIRS